MRAFGKISGGTGAADAVAAVRLLLSDMLDAFVALLEPLAFKLGTRERCVAVLAGDVLSLHRVRGRGRVDTLGPLELGAARPTALRAGPVDLRLPAETFLHRTLVLPDVGRDYLEPILAHRLDKLTPWPSDRVQYGFRVEPGRQADGSITVALLATSGERIAPLRTRLEAVGLTVASIGSAADPLDAPPLVDLCRGRHGFGDARLRRGVAVCSMTALAILVPAFLVTGWLAATAEADLAETAGKLATLQRHIRGTGNGARSQEGSLIGAKQVETSTLTLLDRLSAALPDHTVLRELDIGAEKVRLVGRSADAAGLIGQIEGHTGLSAVRFVAPVTRDAERHDLFEIAAGRPPAPGRDP